MTRILIVDDEEGMREVCADTLERLGEGVELVQTGDPRQAAKLLEEQEFDLLLSDIRMPGMDGVTLLAKAREFDPELPVIMLTGFPSVETAVEAMKLGAVDYISKPFLPEELLANVERFLGERRLRDENRLLRRQLEGGRGRFGALVGDSPAMRRVFDVIERVAATDVDVLILGETGTGKELVARALHERSGRKDKRFVPVDCGAIPENLLESELFGYEKGAFTGAAGRSIGLLEYAHQGSFFLDELGELPPLLQAKLLRALQERSIRRVGGRQEVPVDVRVVAATGRDLEQEVKEGRFREDLFYRVNVVKVELPPLRDRGDDVLLLAESFRERCSAEMNKPVDGFTAEVREVLREYRWPGNVRELQNVVRRGIAMTRGKQVTLEDLPDHLVVNAGAVGVAEGEEQGFFDLRARRMAAFEKEYLAKKLQDFDGDVTAAARSARIPRGTYYRLMKNHGLKAADFRD
ncbi:MAG: sigma-54-dependent transcriptional regulator [Planctomycetota bacterium]